MTICRQCKHFIESGPIWYDQFCGAVTNPTDIDPVTGHESFVGVNDLGTKYFDDNPHPYARDMNKTGNCELFERWS